MKFNRRFLNTIQTVGKKKGPNANAGKAAAPPKEQQKKWLIYLS